MSPTTPTPQKPKAPAAPAPRQCQFCGALGAETIKLNVQFVKGLPFDPSVALACRNCTPAGFQRAAQAILGQLSDLKRRRAILELNDELRALYAQPGSPKRDEAIARNRAEKTALVNLKSIETTGLQAALARLSR